MGCAGDVAGDDPGSGYFWLHYGVVGFERHDDFAGPVAVLAGFVSDHVLGPWRACDGGYYAYSGGRLPQEVCGVCDAGYRFGHAACCGGCRR